MNQELTREQLMAEVGYDPETGVFTRKHNTSRQRAGDVVGSVRPDGYVRFRVLGREYWAHRLAWLYVHGEMPAAHIDHIDGNPSNNALRNLRVATNSQNMQNQRRASSRNKAGMLGVSLHKQSGLWRARIAVDGVQKTIGYFKSAAQASAAYWSSKAELHPYAPGVVNG